MQLSYVITFIGDDQAGLVESLAAAVADHGGNWLESRLSQLAGKFAGLIHIELAEDRVEALQTALKALSYSGFSVRITAAGDAGDAGGKRLLLTVIGPDRPGIVREVSAALAAQQFNVVEMDSQVVSAAMSAEQLFEANITVTAPATASLDLLQERLHLLSESMTLDIDIHSS